MPTIIAPSVLASDFGNLERDCKMINNSEADWFHIDIMDGVFVPNISFGMPVLAAIQKHAQKPLDVHLMIVDPDRYVETFHKLGAAILTVHYEACTHLHRSLQLIKSFGMKAGVALNPHTPVELLKDTIQAIDLVCIMSVNPGFGGQTFIEHTYEKIKELKELIARWDDTEGNLILVTHYVIVGGTLGYYPSSGELVITNKSLEVLGSIKTKY